MIYYVTTPSDYVLSRESLLGLYPALYNRVLRTTGKRQNIQYHTITSIKSTYWSSLHTVTSLYWVRTIGWPFQKERKISLTILKNTEVTKKHDSF